MFPSRNGGGTWRSETWLQALRTMAVALAGEDAARVLLLRQRKVEAFRAARMDAETEREATAWFLRAPRRA